MGISPTQLLIILVIVILIFGTKKLRNMGGDLGSAFKNFKKAMNDDDAEGKADSKKEESLTDDSKKLDHQDTKDADFTEASLKDSAASQEEKQAEKSQDK